VVDTADGERLGSLGDQLIGLPGGRPATSADGRRVASVSAIDGRAAVRTLPSLDMVTALPPCTRPIAFSIDATRLVLDGQIVCNPEFAFPFQPVPGADLRSRVVEVPSGREILDLGERNVTYAALNPAGVFPAGRYLAVNIGFTSIEIYDMATGQLAASHDFLPEFSFGPSFDPQGRWLTGATDDAVWVLDLAALLGGAEWDEALVMNQPAHTARVPEPRLGADRILATRGYGDGLVRLWDVSTGDMLVELRVDANQAFVVEFSPDGRYLYYPDTGNVVRRFPLDVDELVGLAESRLTRGFTADECRRYLRSADCP
jgi:hypothetical protein